MTLAQTLESYLLDHDVAYALQIHRPSTSSLSSAESAHIDESQLAKSVLVEDSEGFVVAVLPASSRLELARLNGLLGRSLDFSDESRVARLFPDCEVGAIPPLGKAYGLETVVDHRLESCDEVFFEGGDHETLVRMDGATFLELLETALIANIASAYPRIFVT